MKKSKAITLTVVLALVFIATFFGSSYVVNQVEVEWVKFPTLCISFIACISSAVGVFAIWVIRNDSDTNQKDND